MTEQETPSKNDARKELLKAEAAKLGISYKELKAQKKEKKMAKKRSREADNLDTTEHKNDLKRMRSWSKDFDEKKQKVSDSKEEETGRRRTRSMDAKEEANAKTASSTPSPQEWRKENNITIKGHGKHSGNASFPDPFFEV